ncbi:MAG: cyclase family protein [Desulfobacterales bacterium]|nr:cyclase family protein [Desulfobacterales bacterium]
MKFIYLSHVLDETTPVYGNGASLTREQGNRMAAGDSCNTQVWHLSNHIGTHVDAPRHFCRDGAFLDDYPADFWICSSVFCLEAGDIGSGDIVSASCLTLDAVPEDIDLLLIKTGFGDLRGRHEYMMENPGFDPDMAEGLRSRFPNLKMIGFDSISLSSFASRPLGRIAHKAFLDHERPILIIEDMDLTQINQGGAVREAAVVPVRVRNSDAAPCTIIARI